MSRIFSRKSTQYEQTISYACTDIRWSLKSRKEKSALQSSHTNCSFTGRPESPREVMSDCAASQCGRSKGIKFRKKRLRRAGSKAVSVMYPGLSLAGRKVHKMSVVSSPATDTVLALLNERKSCSHCPPSTSSFPLDQSFVLRTRSFTPNMNGDNWSQT